MIGDIVLYTMKDGWLWWKTELTVPAILTSVERDGWTLLTYFPRFDAPQSTIAQRSDAPKLRHWSPRQ